MRPLYFAAAISTLMLGCTLDEPTVEGSTSQAVEGHNRLAVNRLAVNRLAVNRLATNRLAVNGLSSTQFEALEATAQILETEEGRDVYSYVVSCALPAGITIEADVPGAADTAPPATPFTCAGGHCTFAGNLGLASRWLDHRLDKKGEGWVSACLFARVNANNTAESISMRGRHPGLIISVEEMELYTAEEGAFFGNVFIDDPDPNVKPDWNACRGEAKAACGGDIGCGGLGNRDCAAENPATPGFTYCGFKYAGDCADFTPSVPSAYACRTYNAESGTYGECAADGDRKGKGWCGGKRYREVITTWVANN